MLYTNSLKLIFKFCLTLLLLSITVSRYSFAFTSHELIKYDNYTVVIKNNKGEKVENAWVTISLTDNSEQAHFTEPPLYIEFTHQENGRYTARISSNQLEGKIISLSVYAEHHEYFSAEMDQLNRELRVELQFYGRSSTESNLEANHYDSYGFTATGDLQSPGVQIQAVVKSNLGHPINNANLRLDISDGPFYIGTIRQNREIRLVDIGNGVYQTTESVFWDQTHQLELSVYAPDHESTIQQLPNHKTSVNVQLYHNNYYSRCNDDLGQNRRILSSWRNDPWEDCEVDPDRLIEVFGVEERNILNSNTAHLIDSRKPFIHKYAPVISNDFNNYVPRYGAYKTTIESLLKGTALAQASIINTELYEWIELELNANQQISNSELMIKGGQLVSGFSDTFSELNTAMEFAGNAFDVSRAYREGYLNGILMYIAYKGSAAEILNRLDLLANHSWLRDDEAFQYSLSDIKDIYERNKYREVEQIAQAVGTNRVGEAVSDIMFGIALKNALTAAGKSVYAISAGHAAPAVLAVSIKIVAAAAVYDFIRSVEKTGEQRALLSAITQIDRTLFSVPDYYSPAIIEGMSDNQKLDLMMRLQLGVIFNEARAALYSGEFKTWIGYQFQYSEMGARNAEQAYELKMVEVSIDKSLIAQKDLGSILQDLSHAEIEIYADIEDKPDLLLIKQSANKLRPIALYFNEDHIEDVWNENYCDANSSNTTNYFKIGEKLTGYKAFKNGIIVENINSLTANSSNIAFTDCGDPGWVGVRKSSCGVTDFIIDDNFQLKDRHLVWNRGQSMNRDIIKHFDFQSTGDYTLIKEYIIDHIIENGGLMMSEFHVIYSFTINVYMRTYAVIQLHRENKSNSYWPDSYFILAEILPNGAINNIILNSKLITNHRSSFSDGSKRFFYLVDIIDLTENGVPELVIEEKNYGGKTYLIYSLNGDNNWQKIYRGGWQGMCT